ncbi:MAG TPA: disulfide bond formation protein DsbA [Gammaproteobacteria bacterium]|jgi:thiol:disulfide interchange protein DsbA|nr:disulfide bond formation protein DsbA [Gammaproteobacteria bacterium]
MKNLFRAIWVTLALAAAGASQAEVGYEMITPPQNTDNPEKVEVLEFFWYGCPHCYQLEPAFEHWKKNSKADYVEVVRAAPPLNPAWSNHARAFYAAEILGVLDSFHEPMFKALHEDRKRLHRMEDIAKFAGSLGIDENKFLNTMKSPAVHVKINRARQQAIAMGITGVPAVVVNGKYKTSASLAGSYDQMFKIVDEMAEKER